MSTAAQQVASRQNGARSQGATTAEGRARSAQNAIRHGLTGGPLVLADESQEEYDAFEESCILTWTPRTLVEREIVMQMVAANWRLRRVQRIEAAIFNQAFEREMEEMGEQSNAAVAMQRAYADVTENSKAWQSLSRHQRALERSSSQALKTFLQVADRTDELMFQQVETGKHAQESTAKAPREQNEPESDYSSLATLYRAPSTNFMPKMLKSLSRMNSAPSDATRRNT